MHANVAMVYLPKNSRGSIQIYGIVSDEASQTLNRLFIYPYSIHKITDMLQYLDIITMT